MIIITKNNKLKFFDIPGLSFLFPHGIMVLITLFDSVKRIGGKLSATKA